MATLEPHPMYDPARSYDDNYDHGPFGAFAAPEPYVSPGEPAHSVLGYPVHTPFGIPAGPLLNARYVRSALARGFDVVTYKTQRTGRFTVNQYPNVLYADVRGDLTLERAAQPVVASSRPPRHIEHLTITNSFGMPSRGPQVWVPDLKAAIEAEQLGQLVIMSVVGTIREGASRNDYYEDFANVAALAAETGVKAIEVNLSCPNVAGEGILCYTPSAVEDICDRVKRVIGETPLVIKLGYFRAEDDALLGAIISNAAPYVAGISVINTIPAPIVDAAGAPALPGEGRLASGLCGAAIRWAGVDLVHRLSRLRARRGYRYEIFGVGGVMKAADYRAYREAGADVVQSATGAMWDPDLARKVKETV
jgi:dihydroorotate dehydrogenase (NAD+) catalytic subunit